jgi:predicted DNA-binding protein
MEKKRATSICLSQEAKQLLELLATNLGVSQAAILALAIREKATREHIR